MKTKILAVYAALLTCYVVYIHLNPQDSEPALERPLLDVEFVDVRAGSNKEWLGIKSVESYYMHDSRRVLHGESLDIDWKLPKVTVVKKRYFHGNPDGIGIDSYDLSPNPPPRY